MKIFRSFPLFAMFALLAACGGNTSDTTSASAGATDAVDKKNSTEMAPANFAIGLKDIYQDYLKLKDAFTATDAVKTASVADQLIGNLDKVDSSSLTEEQLKQWLREKERILQALGSIKEEKDIKKQREAFSTVSEAIYNSLLTFGIKGLVVYKQYCPMAFDNQGAYWLSDKEVIANPYFGDQMMECGEVKQILEN